MFMGQKCLQKQNILDSLCYFVQFLFNFCFDCTYLSVNRVNAIGENSNFSSQHRMRHPFRTTCFSATCNRLMVILMNGHDGCHIQYNLILCYLSRGP